MRILWTPEQALGLAPDKYTIKTGRTFAQPERWANLGYNHCLAWAEFPLKNKDPFQIKLQLSEARFACNCFSRKSPCTHIISLLLLFIEQPHCFTETTPPDWVDHAFSEPKANVPSLPPANFATIDRQRQANISAGLQELDLWLADLVRSGFAVALDKPKSYWFQMADRLVDMQLGLLAGQIRQLATIPNSRPDWPEQLMAKIGRLHLLAESFNRFDSLPPAIQADLRAAVGWLPRPTPENAGPGQPDRWHVLGRSQEQEGKQKLQRTWLWGQTHNQPAMIFQLVHGQQSPNFGLIVGTWVEADLAFYPGSVPLQAQLKEQRQRGQSTHFVKGFNTLKAGLTAYTQAITANPWLSPFPLALTRMRLEQRAKQWFLRDEAGYALPLSPTFSHGWHLLALSQGQTLALFGEWDGQHFQPLSVWHEGCLLELHILGGVT